MAIQQATIEAPARTGRTRLVARWVSAGTDGHGRPVLVQRWEREDRPAVVIPERRAASA